MKKYLVISIFVLTLSSLFQKAEGQGIISVKNNNIPDTLTVQTNYPFLIRGDQSSYEKTIIFSSDNGAEKVFFSARNCYLFKTGDKSFSIVTNKNTKFVTSNELLGVDPNKLTLGSRLDGIRFVLTFDDVKSISVSARDSCEKGKEVFISFIK